MSASPKRERDPQQRCPVVMPVGWEHGDMMREHENVRRDSDYTSMRVSKATAKLLRELASISNRRRYSVGMDELLYWDALQRLGRLPEALAGRPPIAERVRE